MVRVPFSNMNCYLINPASFLYHYSNELCALALKVDRKNILMTVMQAAWVQLPALLETPCATVGRLLRSVQVFRCQVPKASVEVRLVSISVSLLLVSLVHLCFLLV